MKVVVYENEKVVNTFEGNDIYIACGRRLFATYDVNCGVSYSYRQCKTSKIYAENGIKGHKENIKKFKIEGVQV